MRSFACFDVERVLSPKCKAKCITCVCVNISLCVKVFLSCIFVYDRGRTQSGRNQVEIWSSTTYHMQRTISSAKTGLWFLAIHSIKKRENISETLYDISLSYHWLRLTSFQAYCFIVPEQHFYVWAIFIPVWYISAVWLLNILRTIFRSRCQYHCRVWAVLPVTFGKPTDNSEFWQSEFVVLLGSFISWFIRERNFYHLVTATVQFSQR